MERDIQSQGLPFNCPVTVPWGSGRTVESAGLLHGEECPKLTRLPSVCLCHRRNVVIPQEKATVTRQPC